MDSGIALRDLHYILVDIIRVATDKGGLAASASCTLRSVECCSAFLRSVISPSCSLHRRLCPWQFQAWWEHKQWDAKSAASGRLAGAVGKLDGIALRLALVLELLVWAWGQCNTAEPQRVSVQSVRNSMRLIDDWVRPSLERVFAEASLPQAQRDAMTVGRWLLKTRPNKINARDLRRQAGFPGPKEAKELDAALEVLIDAKWLMPAPGREGDRSGRERKDFRVNPRIYEGQS